MLHHLLDRVFAIDRRRDHFDLRVRLQHSGERDAVIGGVVDDECFDHQPGGRHSTVAVIHTRRRFVMNLFRALVAEQHDGGGYGVTLKELTNEELPAGGEVLVDIAFSSLNYKDALAVTGRGKIIRKFPMVPGIDLAGTVVESTDARYKTGDRVIGLAHGLGELNWGGYAERQRVRADVL